MKHNFLALSKLSNEYQIYLIFSRHIFQKIKLIKILVWCLESASLVLSTGLSLLFKENPIYIPAVFLLETIALIFRIFVSMLIKILGFLNFYVGSHLGLYVRKLYRLHFWKYLRIKSVISMHLLYLFIKGLKIQNLKIVIHRELINIFHKRLIYYCIKYTNKSSLGKMYGVPLTIIIIKTKPHITFQYLMNCSKIKNSSLKKP